MRNKLSLFAAALIIVFVSSASAQDEKTVQCRALDAMGQPIPKATIQTWFVPEGKKDARPADTAMFESDKNGNFTLPQASQPLARTVLRLMHPDYGTAESDARFFELGGTVYFPLVRKGTEIESRALRGFVVDPENRPVAGARVTISDIWAMGDWRYGPFREKAVFTDKDGRFAFCLPVGPAASTQCSAPVPQNSWFFVTVVQPDFAFFPDMGVYRNSEEAVIRLVRPERLHRFVFLDPDGQPLADADLEQLTLCVTRDNLNMRARLPANYAVERVKLAPGRYCSSYGGRERTIEVTKDSPEELVFRLPPPVTYVGRVVDGVTGKPLAGAFVMPQGDISLLATLTAEDWEAMHALPATQNPETTQMGEFQVHSRIVRTDADGNFAFTRQVAEHFDRLTVFDEGLLPFVIETEELKADDLGRLALPDTPLFPAAKVLVKPVSGKTKEGFDCSWLGCNWLLQKEGQPEWFARFSKSATGNRYDYDLDLRANKEIVLYVPAGLGLRLSFWRFDFGWVPREYPQTFLFAPGEVKKLDDLAFTPCFKVSVRVADARGKPLAWINVQGVYDGNDDERDILSSFHKSDSAGLIQFDARPGSSGRFVVAALEKRTPAAGQPKAEAAFRIPADKTPAQPFVITLSDQQVEQLSKLPPALK